MRIFTTIFGLFTALLVTIGAFAKANHYPGGSTFLIFSVGLFIPLYLLFVMINTYKERKVLAPFLISGFFLVFFLFGILFLLMHWPGGSAITFIMFLPLIICLFGFAIVYATKKDGERKLNPTVITLSIISLSLIYASTFRSTTKANLIGQLIAAENEAILGDQLSERIKHTYASLDSSQKENFSTVQRLSNEAIRYISNIRNYMLDECGAESSNSRDYQNISRLDDNSVPAWIMQNDNRSKEIGYKIQNLITSYQNMNLPAPAKEKIVAMLSLNPYENLSEGEEWSSFYFNNTTLIGAINTLHSIQNKIMLAEEIALNEFKK